MPPAQNFGDTPAGTELGKFLAPHVDEAAFVLDET
jgi:hypothetical protein